MQEVKGDDILRRAYTRSMPAVLRPLSMLENSVADVQAQWHAILAELVVEGAATGSALNVRAALCRVERLASQLKAVKQELAPQMGRVVAWENSEPSFLQYCTWAASGVSSSSSCDVVPHELARATRLAACVCVWCVCVATVLNDMELLSGSLSFAASNRLFGRTFHEGESSSSSSYSSSSFSYSFSEASAFFLGKLEHCASHVSDRDVVLVCELLYNLFTKNNAAAEVAFRHLVPLMSDTAASNDDAACREETLAIFTQIAEWVVTENYVPLSIFISKGLQSYDSTRFQLPPLVAFFVQAMLDTVVHRQLVQGGFQNVWRPVISLDVSATNNPSEKRAATGEEHSCNSLWPHSVANMRVAACWMLRCESTPPHAPWPLPTALAEKCHCVKW